MNNNTYLPTELTSNLFTLDIDRQNYSQENAKEFLGSILTLEPAIDDF